MTSCTKLLAHGRWFSPGTPASSTTETGRHDIAEILLKVALKHKKSKQNQILPRFKASGYPFGIFKLFLNYIRFGGHLRFLIRTEGHKHRNIPGKMYLKFVYSY